MPLQSKVNLLPYLFEACAQSMSRLLTSLEWPRCSRKHDVAPNRVGSCTRNRAVIVERSQLNPTGKAETYDIHMIYLQCTSMHSQHRTSKQYI